MQVKTYRTNPALVTAGKLEWEDCRDLRDFLPREIFNAGVYKGDYFIKDARGAYCYVPKIIFERLFSEVEET